MVVNDGHFCKIAGLQVANALYMVARFGGGAAGSALGALVWSWAKWPGVCALCLGLSFAALLVHFIGSQRGARVGHRSRCLE